MIFLVPCEKLMSLTLLYPGAGCPEEGKNVLHKRTHSIQINHCKD